MTSEHSALPGRVTKVVFGKKSKVILLCGFIGLNVLVFGLFYLFKNPSTNNKFLNNVPGEIEKPDVSASPVPEESPEPVPEETDKVAATITLLNEELDKQITYAVLSRRNFLLGKAMNSVSSKGKTLQYWLNQDLATMREKMKQELLSRSKNSVSGLGGEYTGKAEDAEKARALVIDLKAVVLALEFIRDTPSEYISPEVLVSRVSVGKLLDQSANLDVELKMETQRQLWESVEKNRLQVETEQNLKDDTKEAIKELGTDGDTSKETTK
jgi:hypothetical protein